MAKTQNGGYTYNLQKIDDSLDRIKESIDSANKKIIELSANQENADNNLVKIEKKVDKLSDKIEAFSVHNATIDEKFQVMSEKVATCSVDLSGISKRVGSIERRGYDKFKGFVDSLTNHWKILVITGITGGVITVVSLVVSIIKNST